MLWEAGGPERLEDLRLSPQPHQPHGEGHQIDEAENLSSGILVGILWAVFFYRKWKNTNFLKIVVRLKCENIQATMLYNSRRG